MYSNFLKALFNLLMRTPRSIAAPSLAVLSPSEKLRDLLEAILEDLRIALSFEGRWKTLSSVMNCDDLQNLLLPKPNALRKVTSDNESLEEITLLRKWHIETTMAFCHLGIVTDDKKPPNSRETSLKLYLYVRSDCSTVSSFIASWSCAGPNGFMVESTRTKAISTLLATLHTQCMWFSLVPYEPVGYSLWQPQRLIAPSERETFFGNSCNLNLRQTRCMAWLNVFISLGLKRTNSEKAF